MYVSLNTNIKIKSTINSFLGKWELIHLNVKMYLSVFSKFRVYHEFIALNI
jgi:hypothetical protein